MSPEFEYFDQGGRGLDRPAFESRPDGKKHVAIEALDPRDSGRVEVSVLEEVWAPHAVDHWNMDSNWREFVETLEYPDVVHDSTTRPGERWLYFKDFESMVRESGTMGKGTLMVVVDHTTTPCLYVSAFMPDNPQAKMGPRLWP